MTLTINGKEYNFKFGIGFVGEMDKRASITQNGAKFGLGLEILAAKLKTWDVLELADALILANKTEDPKISRKELDEYIENPETDIEQLFEDVIEGLKQSNVTRNKILMQLRLMEEQDQAE